MKLQISTDEKWIKVEENVNLFDLYKTIKKLFPDDLWKEFELRQEAIINWTPPIIIKEYPVWPVNPVYPGPTTPNVPWQPYQPFPWITCQTGTNIEGGFASAKTTYNLQGGVYNIDCPKA